MSEKIELPELELKFVSGICIGLGAKGNYSEMVCNTILPENDGDYEDESFQIEGRMKVIADAVNYRSKLIEYLKELSGNVDKIMNTNGISYCVRDSVLKSTSECQKNIYSLLQKID